MNLKSTRDGFGDQLLIEGENPNIIVLGADLSGPTKTNQFKEKYPTRFIECGIAEANMIGIASGLAEQGFRVVLSSFGSFISGRYDIIRCSLAYPNVPIIIVGTHSGLAIGRDGVTQMGTEDIGVLRSMPNLEIYQPATYLEARAITTYLCKRSEPKLSYLRLGRQPVEEIFETSYNFKPYLFQTIYKSEEYSTVTLFNSGCMLKECLEIANRLEKKSIYCRVINVPVIKPINELLVENINPGLWVTVEDHSIIGGLGSAVAELIAESPYDDKPTLLRIGINDTFAESGKPEDLYFKYGLTVETIYDRILNEIN